MTEKKLSFEFSKLDLPLQGAFEKGLLSEWGCPPGKGGREVLLKLLINSELPVAWVYQDRELLPYPPAFAERGADLKNFYFIYGEKPLHDLKALFTTEHFPIIVLDNISRLKREELALLRQWARTYHYKLFILRSFFLSNKNGNPFSRFRFNVSWQGRAFSFRILKGTRPQTIEFSAKELGHEHSSFV